MNCTSLCKRAQLYKVIALCDCALLHKYIILLIIYNENREMTGDRAGDYHNNYILLYGLCSDTE